MDTESSRQGTDRVADEIPSRNLPPVTFRDMPNPLPLWKLLGPGVIMDPRSCADRKARAFAAYGEHCGNDG